MKKTRLTRISESFRSLSRVQQVLAVAFVLATLVTAGIAFSMVRQFIVSTTSFNLPGLALSQGETNGEPNSAPAVAQSLSVDLEEWDGTSRVNILLMGLDARDWASGDGPPRTDSMILFTFDPATNTAGMLSIPRDLWVDVPGFGHNKINAAYQLGEGSRLPGGGPGLAIKTVEQFLGITINYYAQVDFSAFERFIDLIGGVKIDVPNSVDVQVIGEEYVRRIEQGRQVLNGAYALAYARARHSEDGDFDRARRQQEVVLAIRQQLMRDDVRSLLITRGFQIYQDLSSGINTNMTLDEMFSLGFTLRNVEPETIKRAVISPPDYVTLGTSPDGLSILKPLTENIRSLRDDFFNTSSVRSVVAINSASQANMQAEAATVAVYNGSNNSGVADTTRAYLQAQGFNIVTTGNANAVGATTLIDYTGNPYTLQYLVEIMGVSPGYIFSRYDPNSQVDVEVIIGPDWVPPSQ
ncbi:MAG TPA: LCP family protein [Anaerolineales bacterium]|nr:LCP family protein [Anaerolineales bacterium]HRQ93188.1 LCP family protein [Anaerolineales bacterium]